MGLGGVGRWGGGWGCDGKEGVKGVQGEQLWRHSQMKSNLIVITVASALITTTGTIIPVLYGPPFVPLCAPATLRLGL